MRTVQPDWKGLFFFFLGVSLAFHKGDCGNECGMAKFTGHLGPALSASDR